CGGSHPAGGPRLSCRRQYSSNNRRRQSSSGGGTTIAWGSSRPSQCDTYLPSVSSQVEYISCARDSRVGSLAQTGLPFSFAVTLAPARGRKPYDQTGPDDSLRHSISARTSGFVPCAKLNSAPSMRPFSSSR